MTNQDDVLQNKLEALEQGVQLQQVIQQIPAEDTELVSLLKLAAAVRKVDHPLPSATTAQFNRRIAASEKTFRQRVGGGSFMNNITRKLHSKWVLIPAFAAVLGLCLFALLSMVGLGLLFGKPSGAQAATLMDVSGQVEVASNSNTAEWTALKNGDQVRTGQRIRTAAHSSATLVFYEGTRTTLNPNSDITLTRVDGDRGKVLRVVLSQNAGKTTHSVVPFQDKPSSFMVFTPSGEASVHGTIFNVEVSPLGKSRFSVDRGKVLVSDQTSQYYVNPGQAVASSTTDGIVEAPAYEFSLAGVVSSIVNNVWTVNGVPVTVVESTTLDGDPISYLNTAVRIEGRVLNGEWVADTITASTETAGASTFSGNLDQMGSGDEAWQVNGWSILVNDQTVLGDGLVEGQPVKVVFTLMPDGRWLAVSIDPVVEEGTQPTPVPTVVADPTANPVLAFEKDLVESESCPASTTSGYDFTGALLNSGATTTDVAAGVELAYQVTQGAEYVDSITLTPTQWDQVAVGQKVEFTAHVALNQAAWSQAPEGTQVQVRVFVSNGTNQADVQDLSMTVTVKAVCPATAEPTTSPTGDATTTVEPTTTTTPEVTATPEVTETVTPTTVPTDENDQEGEETGRCTGAQQHPTGQTLALRYNVPYEEIMGWFCQGFGFGEIDTAYSLSLTSQKPVAEIFAMKTSGMGWGNIKKELAPSASPTNAPAEKQKKKH